MRQLGRIQELLDLFRAENPGKIKVATLNPFSAADRGKAADLAKLIPTLTVTEGGVVVVEVGEGESARRTLVRNKDLFAGTTAEANAPSRRDLDFNGEDALIAALAQLREGKAGRVAFVTGHGEPSIHDAAPNRPGLGLLRERLESFGAKVVVRNLVGDPLPPDVEFAILAGPVKPFQPAWSSNASQSYVEGGGRLLVLLGWSRPEGGDRPGGLAQGLRRGGRPRHGPRPEIQLRRRPDLDPRPRPGRRPPPDRRVAGRIRDSSCRARPP